MNKSALALLFAALLVAGVIATPRTLQNDNDKAAEAAEHFRILEELEQVHQLRERMLQEGMLRVKHSADKWIVVNQLFEPIVRHGLFLHSGIAAYTCSLRFLHYMHMLSQKVEADS